MYVHIFGYLVNKLEIWWVYLSPIDICNIVVLTKMEHSPTVKPERVYNVL